MMPYVYFSHNGQLEPTDQAVVPLDDIAYAYGFGVYETVRINKGQAVWLADHLGRLQHSAEQIQLEHNFSTHFITTAIYELIAKNQADSANLKIILTGGRTASDANFYLQLHNPLYPDRKLYRDGCHTITVEYERLYPQAKTLNMLPSYLAYRQAQAADAYDALLVNRHGEITEGTRTNFFAMRDCTIYTAPEDQILPGVMRKHVLDVACANDYHIVTEPIRLDNLASYDAAFLTSTSTKIMPIKSVDTITLASRSAGVDILMKLFADIYQQ